MSDSGSYVVNPEAIGNPDATPVVHVGADLAALLNRCTEAAPSSEDGVCGGVNGFHADDCPARATEERA